MADGGHSAAGVHWPSFHRGGKNRDDVSVITEARPSYEDEFRSRRKRYVIMMAMRLPALVLAAVLYQTPWLAVLIILVSIPLPWMAVLIANDGPARKKQYAPRRVMPHQRALTGSPRDVIDSSADSGPHH